MQSWTLEILRQSGADLWMVVCAVAAGLAVLRVIVGRVWEKGQWSVLGLAGLAAVGTLLVICVPGLHSARVGMVWTFVCLATCAGVFYWPVIGTVGRRRGAALLCLRVAVLGMLVLMLFEPVARYIETWKPDRPLYLLVDDSGSMSVPDVQNGPTRLQAVWQALEPQLPELEKQFDVKLRTFAGLVQEHSSVKDLATLQAKGEMSQSTDIVAGVGHVLNETPRRDAVIVLVSDGIDNVSADVPGKLGASQRPVHTLAVGSEQTQSAAVMNVAVESVDCEEELTVGHEAKLVATITSSGLSNRVVDVKWGQLDNAGKALGETKSEKLVLEPRPGGQKVELKFKPSTIGLQRLAVWIDAIPGERTTVDNRQEFQALALDPRLRVLYVEGRARPEYREIKRALNRDSNIELADLLRVQQDRFSASGTADGEKLTGMPSATADWRKFDVIILGDLDISFLTKAQQAAIEQAVSDGSGLLMIGGQSSFGPGNYAGSAIERALPVMVGAADAKQETTQFVPRLTPQGQMHPAMDGLIEWFGVGDKKGEKELPPINGNVVVPKAKSGASVLLTHYGRSGPDGTDQIVLAVENYGKGRSAAFTADTTYLWYLPLRGMGQDSPYNRFWGQLVRWLAGADVKNRQKGAGLEAMLSRSVYQLGENAQVKAMVRDERGDATNFAAVQAVVKRSDRAGKEQRVTLTPLSTHTGMYEAKLPQLEPGEWELVVTANKEQNKLGQQALKFLVIAPADELTQLGAKPQLLAAISQRTKGYAYPLAQAPQLVNQLIRGGGEGLQTKQVTVPLANVLRWVPALAGRPAGWNTKYDLPMQAVGVLGLLMVEWFLRRRWTAGV